MRSLLVVSLLALLTTIAAAQAVPAGWVEDRTHAQVIERDILIGFPEGALAKLKLSSHRSPEPGGQLLAWSLEVGVNGDGGGFVRQRIDDLHATVDAIASGSGQVRTVHWSEQADAKQKWVEARLEWADDENDILSIVRAVWVRPASGGTIREHRAECVLAADAAASLRPACDQALAALEVTPLADRQAFEVPGAAAAAPDEADDADDAEAAPAGAPAAPGEQATMRETPGHVGPVLATREAKTESRDLRPFYVAGFIMLVVAVLLWNRKKRADLDRAEAKEAAARPEAEPAAEPEPEPAADDDKPADEEQP